MNVKEWKWEHEVIVCGRSSFRKRKFLTFNFFYNNWNKRDTDFYTLKMPSSFIYIIQLNLLCFLCHASSGALRMLGAPVRALSQTRTDTIFPTFHNCKAILLKVFTYFQIFSHDYSLNSEWAWGGSRHLKFWFNNIYDKSVMHHLLP